MLNFLLIPRFFGYGAIAAAILTELFVFGGLVWIRKRNKIGDHAIFYILVIPFLLSVGIVFISLSIGLHGIWRLSLILAWISLIVLPLVLRSQIVAGASLLRANRITRQNS